MKVLGRRITKKPQPFGLRFFESMWAVQVAYPAGKIGELGFQGAVNEDRFYFGFYAIMALGFFLAAGDAADADENPWRYRWQAAGVMIGTTVVAVAFPFSWMFVALTIAALVYYFWPRVGVESA